MRSSPEGLSFRSATRADAEMIGNIAASAFGSSDTRLTEIKRYLTLQPNYWLLATLQGRPAGVVGATDYGPFAYLGMMTVRKEIQRRGIGEALFRRELEWLEEEGIPFLRLDATEDGYPIYLRSGFEVVDQAAVFQRSTNKGQPADASRRPLPGGIVRLTPVDLERTLELDRSVFGGERTHLFRALLQDFPGRVFATRDEAGTMTGILFAQHRRLGPWVARHPRDAEALLRAALTLPFRGQPLAVVPASNPAAVDLLERFGFSRGRGARHMQRGSTDIPGDRTMIYGQTSFAIG